MKPLVKVCGLRRAADAELAVDLGASYLGCVMAKDSPRCASVADVQAIVSATEGRVPVVLAFRNNSAGEILALCGATGVRRVQVHGVDPLALEGLRFYGVLVHPVFRVDRGSQQLPVQDPRPTVDRPGLLDTGAGGTGTPFAWQLLGERGPDATFVAGGVAPENIAELLEHRPYGVDVSSGIEASPGVKDTGRMRDLFAEIAEVRA